MKIHLNRQEIKRYWPSIRAIFIEPEHTLEVCLSYYGDYWILLSLKIRYFSSFAIREKAYSQIYGGYL